MAKPGGVKIGLHAVAQLFQNWQSFSKLAGLWSAVVPIAVAATCFVIAMWQQSEASTVIVRMHVGDLLQVYAIVSSLAAVFGQLAVTIGWFRFLLLGERPDLSFAMPPGSARYFSRSVILLFACVALAIPGFIAGTIVGRFVPGSAGELAGGLVMAIGALAAAYFCVRAWLVFPAIAIRDDDIGFYRSFELGKGYVGGIIIGTLIAYAPFMVAFFIVVGGVDIAVDLGLEGVSYLVVALVSEFMATFITFAATAASAGVMAQIYRDAVPARTDTVTAFG